MPYSICCGVSCSVDCATWLCGSMQRSEFSTMPELSEAPTVSDLIQAVALVDAYTHCEGFNEALYEAENCAISLFYDL